MLEHRQEHTELSDENEDEWILEYFANFWIWKISELPGPKTKTKYVGQRYWSKEAIKHYEKNGITGLRHEHVYPRKKLIEKIMHKCRNRDDIKKELKKITACIITKDEHSMLNNEKERWERYIDTGIKVVDLYKNKELSNEDLIDLNNKKNSYG